MNIKTLLIAPIAIAKASTDLTSGGLKLTSKGLVKTNELCTKLAAIADAKSADLAEDLEALKSIRCREALQKRVAKTATRLAAAQAQLKAAEEAADQVCEAVEEVAIDDVELATPKQQVQEEETLEPAPQPMPGFIPGQAQGPATA